MGRVLSKKNFYMIDPKESLAKQNIHLRKMMKLAKDGIISFSTKPLKIVGGLGIFSILLSMIILIYSILSYALNWNNLADGWTSIMVCITFFAGVQLFSLYGLCQNIFLEYMMKVKEDQSILLKKK